MIQITSGILKSIQLELPKGKQTRPSSARLRQAIFNVLRNLGSVEGSVVVDLFAGTGAWGFEALSNGAQEVWFIENDRNAIQTLTANIGIVTRAFEAQGLGLPQMHLVREDVFAAYPRIPKARILFADPPYASAAKALEKILSLEEQFSKLEQGGLLLFEVAKNEKLGLPTSLQLEDTKIYGDSAVYFYRKLG